MEAPTLLARKESPIHTEPRPPCHPAGKSLVRWIPHGVFFCRTSSDVLVFDIRKDKYFSISHQHINCLEACVVGFARENTKDRSTIRQSPLDTDPQILTSLERRGLLTACPDEGKAFSPIELPCVDISKSAAMCERQPRVKVADIIAVTRCWVKAKTALRFKTLQIVLDTLKSQRELCTEQRTLTAPDELFAIFHSVRSMLFRSEDQCLPIAIALKLFMLTHGVCPTLVIGVSADPFAAHSWLQMDRVAFDAHPEKLDYLRPIYVG